MIITIEKNILIFCWCYKMEDADKPKDEIDILHPELLAKETLISILEQARIIKNDIQCFG